MLVADLRHFLDLPEHVPGPARRLAEQLAAIVRAATAGRAGSVWVSALTCPRRPGRRPCSGHIAVFRADLPAPIEWECTACGDAGVISGWEESPYDLRMQRGTRVQPATLHVSISDEAAATLRSLLLLDRECERLVFQARVADGEIVLATTEDGLESLIGFVAAEANHEPDRRRRQRLDAAFDSLHQATER